MRIPHTFNPLGKTPGAKHFELVVKPGILASDMTYGFTPYWNSGGYCSVDWGDGQKKDATISGTKLNHTYAVAGTYAIRIDADCYRVQFGDWSNIPIVDSCSDNLFELGVLNNADKMFAGCGNLSSVITKLPDGIVNGYRMFYSCGNIALALSSLPASLTSGSGMFEDCSKAQFYFTELPTGLTSCNNMFRGTKSNFYFTELPDSITDGYCMFYATPQSSFTITKLPSGLVDGNSMFYYTGAKINLDTLVANAPVDGWTALTNISSMFAYSSNVTGSRSAFLAKCPNATANAHTFVGTNTTE